MHFKTKNINQIFKLKIRKLFSTNLFREIARKGINRENRKAFHWNPSMVRHQKTKSHRSTAAKKEEMKPDLAQAAAGKLDAVVAANRIWRFWKQVVL